MPKLHFQPITPIDLLYHFLFLTFASHSSVDSWLKMFLLYLSFSPGFKAIYGIALQSYSAIALGEVLFLICSSQLDLMVIAYFIFMTIGKYTGLFVALNCQQLKLRPRP